MNAEVLGNTAVVRLAAFAAFPGSAATAGQGSRTPPCELTYRSVADRFRTSSSVNAAKTNGCDSR